MRRVVALAVLLAAAGCKWGPEFEPPPPSSTRLPESRDTVFYQSVNEFAFRLAREIDLGGGEGAVISPLAINQSISMLLSATSGAANQSAKDVLGFFGEDVEAHHDSHRALLNQIAESPGEQFKVSSSLFSVWPMVLDDGYIEEMGKTYGASVKKLGGYRIEAVRLVNKWVEESTEGRMSDLVSVLDKDDVLILASVAHFTGGGGRQHLRYTGDGFDALAVPIGGGYSLTVLDPRAGLADLVHSLDTEVWKQMLEGLEPVAGDYETPSIWLDTQLDLAEQVDALGGGVLFGKDNNFRPLSIEMESGYGISKVLHRAVVEISSTGGQNLIDPPFLFAVTDRLTGTIVLLGAVTE